MQLTTIELSRTSGPLHSPEVRALLCTPSGVLKDETRYLPGIIDALTNWGKDPENAGMKVHKHVLRREFENTNECVVYLDVHFDGVAPESYTALVAE